VILLNEVEIGVVEACSGLRMLVIFFALSTGVALLTRRPLWEKTLLVASAIPIALMANITRITATGILHELDVGSAVTNAVFHDLAGWLMMPLGLALLGIELTLLNSLLLEPATSLVPSGHPAAQRGRRHRALPPRQRGVVSNQRTTTRPTP
jgi:exosortase/archaeosortase family protein